MDPAVISLFKDALKEKANVFLCRRRHLRKISMQNWADVLNILLSEKFLIQDLSRNFVFNFCLIFSSQPTFHWLGKCQITAGQLFAHALSSFAEKYFPELEINFAFLHRVAKAPTEKVHSTKFFTFFPTEGYQIMYDCLFKQSSLNCT